ncbi:MAG: N-formylglutamate deformylase [Alphaproteobacteria bacterium]|nr:N-formylglutamate deformylase [Alphaproteobacteria bacterium]
MATEEVYNLHRGRLPLLVSIPHGGTDVPAAIATRLTEHARILPDTDWHVERLYAFARDMGASVLAARLSRYVIDLNRPRDGQSLYPGQATTGLVPTTDFDGVALYRPGQGPGDAEIATRVTAYWAPYHDALAAHLDELRARHGVALLWDAHSIRSRVPRLFDGTLPDFNLGTNGGASADAALTERVHAVARAAPYTTALNGRFKGGHITRSYGRPSAGVHAIQLELAQATYMDEAPPYAYRPERATRVHAPIRAMIEASLDWSGT